MKRRTLNHCYKSERIMYVDCNILTACISSILPFNSPAERCLTVYSLPSSKYLM
jgi:hypothetical protein